MAPELSEVSPVKPGPKRLDWLAEVTNLRRKLTTNETYTDHNRIY